MNVALQSKITRTIRWACDAIADIDEAQVAAAAACIIGALKHGHKILIAGNGGSAAQAQHFASELVGRFADRTRPALPAIALSTDGSLLTAIANDFGATEVFDRQVRALGSSGDVFLWISTSGQSMNVKLAALSAEGAGMRVIALVGRPMDMRLGWLQILTPGGDTAAIQAAHLVVLHALADAVDEAYAPE